MPAAGARRILLDTIKMVLLDNNCLLYHYIGTNFMVVVAMKSLAILGDNLRSARKKRFPKDDMRAFALRIGVARATLQKMEKGDLNVSLAKYYMAAEVLDLTHTFDQLLKREESLFDD